MDAFLSLFRVHVEHFTYTKWKNSSKAPKSKKIREKIKKYYLNNKYCAFFSCCFTIM